MQNSWLDKAPVSCVYNHTSRDLPPGFSRTSIMFLFMLEDDLPTPAFRGKKGKELEEICSGSVCLSGLARPGPAHPCSASRPRPAA
jgi:hypothetical protein